MSDGGMFYATKVTIQQKRDEAMFRSLGDKRLFAGGGIEPT